MTFRVVAENLELASDGYVASAHDALERLKAYELLGLRKITITDGEGREITREELLRLAGETSRKR